MGPSVGEEGTILVNMRHCKEKRGKPVVISFVRAHFPCYSWVPNPGLEVDVWGDRTLCH